LKVKATAFEEVPGNTARENSGREKVETSAKGRVDKYHSFFAHSRDSFFILGPDGQVLEANPAACAAFQMKAAELCNIELNRIVDVTDARFDPFIEELQRAGTAMAETTFIRKDGGGFPGEITASLYKNGPLLSFVM
jgi:PAS domain S-box-containing protein